jgi:hypothetical protein
MKATLKMRLWGVSKKHKKVDFEQSIQFDAMEGRA